MSLQFEYMLIDLCTILHIIIPHNFANNVAVLQIIAFGMTPSRFKKWTLKMQNPLGMYNVRMEQHAA